MTEEIQKELDDLRELKETMAELSGVYGRARGFIWTLSGIGVASFVGMLVTSMISSGAQETELSGIKASLVRIETSFEKQFEKGETKMSLMDSRIISLEAKVNSLPAEFPPLWVVSRLERLENRQDNIEDEIRGK